MKCPECVTANQTSRVYPDMYSVTTDMGWFSYYDEDGKYHNHNPNCHSESFSCSNGYKWGSDTLRKCDNCDYGAESPTT